MVPNPSVVGDNWNRGTLVNGDYQGGTVQNGQSVLDVLWNLSGAVSSSSTIVLELAGNANVNTFGFYDPANPTKRAQLFGGSATAGSKVFVRFSGNQLQTSSTGANNSFANVANGNFSSSSFGVYLGAAQGIMYSDPALNGGYDNMIALKGYGNTSTGRKLKVGNTVNAWDADSYVLAWEDLRLTSSDKDYQDMVLLVSGVTPVPETSTTIALSFLLIPIAAQLRRQFRKTTHTS
jgi:hypothetical protein